MGTEKFNFEWFILEIFNWFPFGLKKKYGKTIATIFFLY